MSKRILMCAPDAYALKYEINAWMHIEDQPDLELAARQWRELYRTLTEEVGVEVDLIPQPENAPDMVFSANAGLVHGNRVLLARFRHPERQVEVRPFRDWFVANGFEVVEPPKGFNFEGEGDALFSGDVLVAGYLKRSDIAASRWLSDELGIKVLSLELVDDRWYHLDTAFFSLEPGLIAYYPSAFDQYGQRVLENAFATIHVEESEARLFACNSVVIGSDVVMPAGCPNLKAHLESRGCRVFTVEMSEFIKSGGAAKCLTLHLN